MVGNSLGFGLLIDAGKRRKCTAHELSSRATGGEKTSVLKQPRERKGSASAIPTPRSAGKGEGAEERS